MDTSFVLQDILKRHLSHIQNARCDYQSKIEKMTAFMLRRTLIKLKDDQYKYRAEETVSTRKTE